MHENKKGVIVFELYKLAILLLIICINYISLIITHIIKKRLNFNNFFARKSLYFLLVIAVTAIDKLSIAGINFDGMINVVIDFFIAIEILYILKNISKANVLLPAALANKIEQLEAKILTIKKPAPVKPKKPEEGKQQLKNICK